MTAPRHLTAELADRFARLALSHVGREYPHKLDHVLVEDADAQAPRDLHPIFFGSFDWHSCVHGYWLLARLHRRFPKSAAAPAVRAQLDHAFTPQKLAVELAYLARPSSRGFERPYGWAWLLMLQAELLRHETGEGRRWAATLRPMAEAFAERFCAHLPLADYPVRAGTHANTAFALALAHDYARMAGDQRLAELIKARALDWYGADADCQAWEPSGDDFLSSALIEALALQRVLEPEAFRAWFAGFLPRVAQRSPASLFTPAKVADRSDGKIAHLDGLNLSRAWCWREIAAALDPHDPAKLMAAEAADRHLEAGLPHVAGDYMGEHWLATYALLALEAPL